MMLVWRENEIRVIQAMKVASSSWTTRLPHHAIPMDTARHTMGTGGQRATRWPPHSLISTVAEHYPKITLQRIFDLYGPNLCDERVSTCPTSHKNYTRRVSAQLSSPRPTGPHTQLGAVKCLRMHGQAPTRGGRTPRRRVWSTTARARCPVHVSAAGRVDVCR